MSIIQKPSPLWAVTILRITLGAFCLRLGLWGYVDRATFDAAVRSYTGFGDSMVAIYAALGPYVIFGVGALLLMGLFTRVSALLAFFVLLPLVCAAGGVAAIENPIAFLPEQRTIYKDIAVLMAFLALATGGSGALGFDNVLRDLYREK